MRISDWSSDVCSSDLRSAHELLLDPSVGDDAAASPFTARSMVEEAELWVRSAGGAEVCLLATALPLTAGSGAWIGARGVCRNITRLRCHEADLAEARNRARLFSYIVKDRKSTRLNYSH